jgi:hypothetical protein
MDGFTIAENFLSNYKHETTKIQAGFDLTTGKSRNNHIYIRR